jgi:fructokinase
MAREHKHRITMIDPNVRPGFITNEQAYRSRITHMMALADIVKLSDEDLAWLEGADDTDAIAARILAKDCKLLILTLGADGATAYTPEHKITVPSKQTTVADTVGAGDTFNAGVLVALNTMDLLHKDKLATLSEQQITKALQTATAAAAITVSRPGANPPWLEELGQIGDL